MIWSGILPNVTSVAGSTTTKTTAATCFPFLQTLGRTIRHEQERYHTLQFQYHSLEINLQGWKDTAEKLSEDVWQSEKDALIQNFWTLYRKTHDELRQTQLELQQLEDRQMAAREGSGSLEVSSYQEEKGRIRRNHHPRTNNNNNKNNNHATSSVTEQPTDQDELLYDRTTIDRLAAGPLSQPLFRTGPAREIMTTNKGKKKQVSTKKGKKQMTDTGSEPQRSNGITSDTTTTVTNAASSEPKNDEQVTSVGFQLSDVGVVSSAKELFQDIEANRKKRALVQDTSSNRNTSNDEANAATKKTKISDAVDEERRKELEKMAAILGDDDDDDDDDW